MPVADVNGQRLFYEDSGGSGPPVVFSHGFLMDHEMFAPQLDALSGEFRCITWDERGFGQTEAREPFTYWDSACDCLGLLDHLGIGAAVLAGMSQGGFLSMRAALLAPARVKALVLMDTRAGREPEEVRPTYEAMAQQWATEGPTDPLAEAVASIIMSPGYDHSPWVAKWKASRPDAILEPFRTLMAADDITPRLREIACPAIIFHGEADASIAMAEAEVLQRELGNCVELVRIAGGGHACNLSHPAQANGPLRDFLRKYA
ncbi:MAG TPA: alpha/beta hydrolase [Acidimicrobiales bacterium]|nr:alpha/beta hydrolase [Acidimicrobiales bacterium]